jgi:putative intracellular protease/amidase
MNTSLIRCWLLFTIAAFASADDDAVRRLLRQKDNSGMVFIRGGAAQTPVGSFYMDRQEVTNAQFSEFLNDGHAACWNKEQTILKKDGKFAPKPNEEYRPVAGVARQEAESYAKWAGKRLPTEAEWKWAAEAHASGFRCVRPARRVLILLGENFEEIEFAAYSGVLSWASHTRRSLNYVLRAPKAPELPLIEVVVAGFGPEVRSMGAMRIRPDVLVRDLKDEDVDRFDALAVPACVGGGRGRHTYKGRADLESAPAVHVARRVHANGGIVSTMCVSNILDKAKLPHREASAGEPVAFDEKGRTTTSLGPSVAIETACMLLKHLVSDAEYRTFRQNNPWLFGGKDQFAPRVDAVK